MDYRSSINHFEFCCCRLRFFILLYIISAFCLFYTDEPFCQTEEISAVSPGLVKYPLKHDVSLIALDQPIDPATYKLGPGDKISIFVWGNIQAEYNLTVSPEGKLLIPTVGPVEVAGMYLSQAKKKIKSRVLKRFKNVEVNAELADVRIFSVSIGGAVKYPGIYPVNAVSRVSEVIILAGGFVNEGEDLDWHISRNNPRVFPPGIASHRNIIVNHKDGSIDTADVLLSEHLGDLKYNFRLTDGDEIFVPLRDDNINLYGIFGGVKNPAFYEYSSRDSLKDLINLAHGLTLDVDSSFAELVRFSPDGKSLTKTKIGLKEILDGDSSDIGLMPDDRIYINKIKDYNIKHQILVLGEVKYPGFYPIEPESTYLTQVIERAGGFTELASLAEAEMTRYTRQDVIDGEFERLKLMEVADMTDVEYEYFKIKSREKRGRVSVDFINLFRKNRLGDIKLRNGDIIVIPQESEVIKVTGEVANPGLLTYVPELNYRDYIELAGGFSYRANKGSVRIIKGVAGEWKKAKRSTILQPGDIILVPEKKKIKFINTVKEVLAFTANLATVYLVIRESTR